MIKKIVALTAASILALGLSACGKHDASNAAADTNATTAQSATTGDQAAAPATTDTNASTQNTQGGATQH